MKSYSLKLLILIIKILSISLIENEKFLRILNYWEGILLKREYPKRPIVGVGMLIKDCDRIVLVKRINEPGKGLWSIPRGLLELGERIHDGVKRETLEETGLEVEIDGLIDVVDNIIRDKDNKVRFHYMLVDFFGHSIGGSLRAATDVSDARWVSIEEINRFQITNTLKRLLSKMNMPSLTLL